MLIWNEVGQTIEQKCYTHDKESKQRGASSSERRVSELSNKVEANNIAEAHDTQDKANVSL